MKDCIANVYVNTYRQGCTGVGTRGNGILTPYSCFALK